MMPHRRKLQRLVPLIVLVSASCWVIAPVLPVMRQHLPVRPNLLLTVPLFNAWTIWWNADRAQHGFHAYWDAPIFLPEQGTFAFSEPQPATIVVAPVVWLTGSPAAGYNSYLLLSLCLNAIVTFLVLKRNRVRRMPALFGGLMMAWLPIGLRQMEVLQLVPVWGLLWTWDAIRRHGRSPNWKTAMELALAYLASFCCSVHHTLFLSIVLPLTVWVLIPAIRTRRFWTTSVVAASLAGILVGVLVLPMNRILQGRQFERSKELVTRLSAKPRDLLLPPDDAVLRFTDRQGLALSAGWIKMVLAGCGVAFGLCRRKHRRWVLFLALTIVVSSLLSLGPNLKVGSFQPWWRLADWFPGLKYARNVFRFAYLTQMAVILLSVVGLSEMWLRIRKASGRPRLVGVIVSAIAVLALIEVPPPRALLAGVPDLEQHGHWTAFVRNNTPPGQGLACLPFSPGTTAADFEITTRWMYYGTLHGVPLVNGYSGFFPNEYMKLRAEITKDGLTDSTLQQLAGMKTQFIVSRESCTVKQQGDGAAAYTLRLAFEDPVGMKVYELVKPNAP